MAARERTAGATLVAWEHKALPVLAAHLVTDGAKTPRVWPDDRFDLLWVFERQCSGSRRFVQLSQMLLDGDRTSVIEP